MLINGNSSITYVGQEPTPAQAPADDSGEGVKDQAVTEPDVEISDTVGDGQGEKQKDGQEGTEGSTEESTEGASEDDDKKPMSKEERAANAERRREHERQELAQQIRAEEQAKADELVNSVIAGMRLRDESGKVITTKEELDAFNAQRDQQLIDEGLDRAGIDRSVIDAVIQNHPDVKAARNIVAKAETETHRAQDMTAEERGKQQLEIITGMDPSVTDMATLREHESYDRVYERVRDQGLSISDAFFLENREAIEKHRVDAAVQQAMNLQRGKGYLVHDTPHGGGGIDIPEAVKKGFRNTYPGISDAEIQKRYNKIYGKKG